MPAWSLPRSLAELLGAFRPCFTAPTFKTFVWLVVGLVAQPGTRTVTGMLVGARLAGVWDHSRAHRFFAAARWSADALGLVVLEVIVACLLGPGAPLRLVVDDTLFRRSGGKVFGAAWHHDPLAAAGKGRKPVAWANCWVVVGCWWSCRWCPAGGVAAGALPPVAPQAPRPDQAHPGGRAGGLVAARDPDRQVHLTGDAADAAKTLGELPPG
jgi:DDE superfamily endonuclease